MTRTMGDATHADVPALAAAGLDMAAGYVTGGPGIVWTAQDWAMFPSVPHVTIDQGFTGSPVPDAVVRDVEQGAWSISNALSVKPWTAPRPTIYCSLLLLPVLANLGWKGDIWVAWYNGNPALDFTVPPGMNCVAKQYTDTGGGGAYDLSTVFDPTWPQPAADPKENDMMIIWAVSGNAYLLSGGRIHKITPTGRDFIPYYQAGGAGVAGSEGNFVVSAEEEAALLADFPAGQLVVDVTVPPVVVPPVTVTFPVQNLTGTITPVAP